MEGNWTNDHIQVNLERVNNVHKPKMKVLGFNVNYKLQVIPSIKLFLKMK